MMFQSVRKKHLEKLALKVKVPNKSMEEVDSVE